MRVLITQGGLIMGTNGINGNFQSPDLEQIMAEIKKLSGGGDNKKVSSKKLQIKMPESKATQKITKQDVESALNEPSCSKAMNNLLAKSPIGLEKSGKSYEDMGYTWLGTAYHKGAPTLFQSADGGKITTYPGGGNPEMGEDKQKIVYENGNYKQEMFYDDKGNLRQCTITIRNEFTGGVERKMDMLIDENGKKSFINI